MAPNERTPLLANAQAIAQQTTPDLLHIAKIIGAVQAGKLPSQAQVDRALDALTSKNSFLSPDRRRGEGKLSDNGRVILEDVKNVLQKLKVWLDAKNKGDVLQEIFYHSQRASLDGDANVNLDVKAPASTSEVKKDANDLAETFQTLGKLVLNQAQVLKGEAKEHGLNLSGDLILIARDILADAAEEISDLSGKAAEEIRPKEGESGQVPSKEELKKKGKQAQNKVEQKASEDRLNKESSPAADKAADAKDRAVERLIQVANHIQKDDAYKKAAQQLFGLAKKYYKRTGEAIEATAQSANVDGDVYGNEHTKQAGAAFQKLLENLADGRSVDPILEKGQTVFKDIKEDDQLSKLADDIEKFLSTLLEDPDYATSKAPKRDAGKLYDRAQDLLKSNQDWKKDANSLLEELEGFGKAVADDKQSKDVANAMQKLGEDTAKTAKIGASMLKSQAGAIYRDAINVLFPRVLALLKEVPIPRTEYKSKDLEFVIDNFTITSASFVPDNLVITNHSEFAARRVGKVDANANIESSTRVRFDGLRFQAKDVSFYVRRPGALLLSEERGLLDLTLSGKGLSGDLTLALADEDDDETYFRVTDSSVTLHNLSLKIHDNYHYILSTLFSPLLNAAVKLSLQHALSAQISDTAEQLDWRAFDVNRRAQRYQTQGYNASQAYAKALSEPPPSQPSGPSPLAGLHSTSKGFIRDEHGPRGGQIAFGGEQLLPGKSGPKSSLEQSKKNVKQIANQTAKDLDIDGKAKKAKANAPSQQDAAAAKRQADQFKGIVQEEFSDAQRTADAQRDAESGEDTWRSDVFDL